VLTDADRALLIDQQKYFAFEVDDIDKRQVMNAGGLMSEAAQRAAFGLADVTDQFLVQRMLGGALAPTTSAWSTRPRRPTSTTS
jgi:hypothetical protein